MSPALDEREWRLLAERIRPLVRTLLGDPGAAEAFTRDLDHALGLPSGPGAKRELRRVLTRFPETREWIRSEVPDQEDYRTAPSSTRFLEVSAPENAAVRQRVPLYVRITRLSSGRTSSLRAFDVPPQGASVVISLWAPTLIVAGDMEADLNVPAEGDSDPVRFGLVAPVTGLHKVIVRVFRNGTLLGEAAVQVTAETEVEWQEPTVRTAAIPSMAYEPGEVTLHVQRDLEGYRFQFVGEVMHAPETVKRLAADPTKIVKQMAGELSHMAAGRAAQDSAALIRRRLQGRGAELWGVVPEKVREQFWAQAGRISSLTVVSELDVIPWELLYPVDGDRENGFLAQTVPIVRWVYGHRRVRRLAMSRVACIVPPGDAPVPAIDCSAEITMVRSRLSALRGHPDIEELDDLYELVEHDLAGVVHFTGHHDFSDAEGSVLRLHGGELRPVDLEPAARRHPWKSSPLVFLNGCRTAGETPSIRSNTGWAEKFIRIGAGAFIGSLWGVRSESAARFADRFYEHFYQRGEPLGRATLAGRLEIMDETGDPTWLAYTTYGSPTATVAGR
ncbi:CHAT domain-containing protein [Nonomuraea sp. NPDC003201]